VHIGLHNHPSAKGENQKALERMNQTIKTYSKENPSIFPKAISCKLVQRNFLRLFVRKDLVMDGEMLQKRCFVGGVGNSFPFVEWKQG
jgi:hypothetical protein